MPIERQGEWLVNDDPERGLQIGIESEHLDECVREVQKRQARGVFGSPVFGFHEHNLDFLSALPDIEGIWF